MMAEHQLKTVENGVAVTLNHVCKTLEAWTGIPADRIISGRSSFSDTEGLAEALGEHIFGQQNAIDAAVRAIHRRFQLPERQGVRQPIWSALFAGPSGVGKTELAREIARHFFGDGDKHLVKIDLSEFREEHTIARLVGAPPGYKGHGEGGQLTNALRACSSGVLLLDEVEKAHPAILTTVLLPMIGEAVVHDMNDGRSLDVTNMIVVLTSNLGTNADGDKAIGFTADEHGDRSSDEAMVQVAIRAHFPREVLGRLDDVIVFRTLSDDALRLIWRREVTAFEERLTAGGNLVRVDCDPAAEILLLKQIEKAVAREGARAMLRFFDKVIVDRCLDLLRNRTEGAQAIRIEPTEEGGLRYRLIE